jgi:hypothetical protein
MISEADIKAEFGTIDASKMYMLSGSFLLKLCDVVCKIHPIGPYVQEMGATGSYINGGNGAGSGPTNAGNGAYVYIYQNHSAQWLQAPTSGVYFFGSVGGSLQFITTNACLNA